MIELRFHRPARPVSMNDLTHGRGSAGHRMMRPWKNAVAFYLVEDFAAETERRRSAPTPLLVRLELTFAERRTRDPHNYAATLKPVVDGIVAAGWVPDDNPAWVSTLEPVLTVDPSLVCTLYITDREG